MGTSFSTMLLSSHVEPEEKLWRGVLINAFDDAATNSQERKPSIYKCDAHNWIMSNVTDFQQVCYYGGFEPDMVKERYKMAIMNKLISFSPKNFAWKKYSEQFTKYRNCKEPESKAYHRKHLEHLRNAVNLATTVFISNLVTSL
jgi:hypothetical protein